MLQGIVFITKFASKTQRIQVGNGQHISVLFMIPVIIEIAGHRLELYTLYVFELEGIFNSWECCFRFLS